MSTIDEILETISVAEAAETIDELLVIDPNTRQINIPSAELTFGVVSDTHSERKYFQCPRIVGDNIDLASCFIRVNYRNANGEVDAYLVDDVKVVGDNILFSWELHRRVTMYAGQVQFVVCACRPGGEVVSPVEWHTTQAKGIVLAGLEPDGVVVENSTADAITQLLSLVETQSDAVAKVGAEQVTLVQNEGKSERDAIVATAEAEKTATVAEIDAKGTNTLASIPDDYTALGAAVDTLDRSRAGAIVCDATGETVVVSDASNLPMQGIRVFGKTTQLTTTGKNLLDTNNMGTFLNNQNREKTGVVVPIDTDGVYSYYISDSVTVYIGYADSLDVAATHIASALSSKPAVGTVDLKAGQYFLLWFDTGATVRDSTYYSLALGTEITHEPYSGGKPSPSPDFPQELVSLEPMVTVTGKNLFDIETLRVTKQEDGSYLLPAYPKKPMITFPKGYAGQMTISGWIKYDSTDNRGGYIMVQYTDGTDDRVGVINTSLDYQRYEFTTRGDKVILEISVSYGVGTVATYFKDIQVEFGTAATKYEPYSGQTLPITHTLPGIPVASGGNYTDSDGRQWICDEVDLGRGVFVQRIGTRTVSDGNVSSVTVEDEGTAVIYRVYLNSPVSGHVGYSDGFCDQYSVRKSYAEMQNGDDFGFAINGSGNLLIRNDNIATSDELLAGFANNPLFLAYPITTPIETPLSETEIAAYRALCTNKPNTTVLNDAGAWMNVEYVADTKLYIDNKIAALVSGN